MVSDASAHLAEQEPDAKSVNASLFSPSLDSSLVIPFLLLHVLLTQFNERLCLCAVIGVGKACRYAGLQFPHGSRWEEECNNCRCTNGKVDCTKVT